MKDIGLVIKSDLQILLAIREYYTLKYRHKSDGLDKKTHVLIFTVYNTVVPELLKEIYGLLHLPINNEKEVYSIGQAFKKLDEIYYLQGFNYVLQNSANKEAVRNLCSHITFFTRMSFDALQRIDAQ